MKNRDFFYLQYNKINWRNQEKTKINFRIYDYIIKNILLKKGSNNIAIVDIGFGIGCFLKMLLLNLRGYYRNIIIEGCEPSKKQYRYFLKKKLKRIGHSITLNTYNKTFLKTNTDTKFEFITAIYVFPHFVIDELRESARKIRSMLGAKGKFILVVANEKYLESKLKSERDLFIERQDISFGGEKYNEILHYSDIPKNLALHATEYLLNKRYRCGRCVCLYLQRIESG